MMKTIEDDSHRAAISASEAAMGAAVLAIWFTPVITTGSLNGYGLTGFTVQLLLSVLLLSGLFGLEVAHKATDPHNTGSRRSGAYRRRSFSRRSGAPAANSLGTTCAGTNAQHCPAG